MLTYRTPSFPTRRSADLLGLFRHSEHLRHHLDRDPQRFDARSTSSDRTKMSLAMGGDPPLPRTGQMDEAGFLARVGITGDRKSHMGLRPFEGGLRHGDRHGPGYPALLLDQVQREAEHPPLTPLGIGNESPLETIGPTPPHTHH